MNEAPSFRAALDALSHTGRQFFARLMGQTFEGRRDVYGALGYPQAHELTVENFFNLYERGDILSKLIEIYPSEMFSQGAIFDENDDPELSTTWEDGIHKLYKDMDIWSTLERAYLLARIGEFSIIWMASEGDPETPRGTDDIVNLFPVRQADQSGFNGVHITETDFEKDPTSERFGRPTIYTVKIDKAGQHKVHHTRIIHITGRRLDSRVFGIPDYRRVWNKYLDLQKVTGAGSEAWWLNSVTNYAHRKLPNAATKDGRWPGENEISFKDEAELFKVQTDEMDHGLRRHLYTRNIETQTLNPTLRDFSPSAMFLLKVACGALDIPWRIGLGTEESRLAGSADTDKLSRSVSRLQATDGNALVRELNDAFISTSQVGEKDEYEILWTPGSELTEDGKASVALKMAQANNQQQSADGTILLTNNEIRQRVYGEDAIDESSNVAPVGDRSASVRNASSDEMDAIESQANVGADILSQVFEEAWGSVGVSLDVGEMNAAIDTMHEGLIELLPDDIISIMQGSGEAIYNIAKDRGSYFRGASSRQAVDVGFQINDSVVNWANSRAVSLISEIGPDTRAAIELILSEDIPDDKLIRKLRNQIGLRTDQVEALRNLESKLFDAVGGKVVHAGDVAITVPARGSSISFVDRHVNRYANRLLTQRAELVGRSLANFAAVRGQTELWIQARTRGELVGTQMRGWLDVGDNRVRQTHFSSAVEDTAIDQPFIVGGNPREPGEEPLCRCGQFLVN